MANGVKSMIKNKILKTLVGAKSTISNFKEAKKGDVQSGINRMMIREKMQKNLPPSSIMGLRNSTAASRNVRSMVKTGNYAGARAYVREQLQKVVKQAKGTSTEEEMQRRLKKMK